MPKWKHNTVNKSRAPLKCALPPDEALKLAMRVKVPDYWIKPKATKAAKKR
jgi:hypothetical protein